MSRVLRLQNLPVSAKTWDIRSFFEGFWIPYGGVRVLGGDDGVAFIEFMSDEDARLAMRKDGGMIKDCRIKLFLSTPMEMQHAIEKIKGNFHLSPCDGKTAGSHNIKSRSDEKRSRSRSPSLYDDSNFEKNRSLTDYWRFKSPTTHNVKELSPLRFRSQSPKRRSISPKLPLEFKSFVPKGDRLLGLQQKHQSMITEPENLKILPDNSNMHHFEDTVNFKNGKNFEGDFSQNGKKIGGSEKEEAEDKTQPFVPYSQMMSEKGLPTFRWPVCLLLTGLPFNISINKILSFYSESGLKPDTIHLTMSSEKQSDGRAFVEFIDYSDFKRAEDLNGKTLDNAVVCVKTFLCDEMVKILDSQKAKHYFAKPDPAASASSAYA